MNAQAPSQPKLVRLLRLPLGVAMFITAVAAGSGWMLGAVQPESTVQALPRTQQEVRVQSGDAANFSQAWEQVNRRGAIDDTARAVVAPGSAITAGGGEAIEDREMMAVYAQFDAQLKPLASLPAWAMNRNLHAEVSGADSNATVSGIACADEFCRFRVTSAGGTSREELLDKLGSSFAAAGSAVMYRYPDNNAQEAVVYLMNGVTPLARYAESQRALR